MNIVNTVPARWPLKVPSSLRILWFYDLQWYWEDHYFLPRCGLFACCSSDDMQMCECKLKNPTSVLLRKHKMLESKTISNWASPWCLLVPLACTHLLFGGQEYAVGKKDHPFNFVLITVDLPGTSRVTELQGCIILSQWFAKKKKCKNLCTFIAISSTQGSSICSSAGAQMLLSCQWLLGSQSILMTGLQQRNAPSKDAKLSLIIRALIVLCLATTLFSKLNLRSQEESTRVW